MSELRASRATWDVVTLYLITFSRAVMNAAAALSTKAKSCLELQAHESTFSACVHVHTSTLEDIN